MTSAAEKLPLLEAKMAIPPASFTSAYSAGRGSDRRSLPQAIAHRGYKAAYPENTMGAFRGAVAVGAHALETDLHLSRDGVVVLSHDATLQRCFGEKTKLSECDWSYLSTVRTVRQPHSPMPRLSDLLEYLAQPGLEDVWVLLDIKRDDDAAELLRRTAETIASVPASRPWSQRLILGCWTAKYMKVCRKFLPGFPITYIGFSIVYARQYLKVPNVSFNMLQKALVGGCGTRFIQDAKAAGRPIYVWTVNEEEQMEWSIEQGVDGVITDDPKLFLDVCERYKETAGEPEAAVVSRRTSRRRKGGLVRRWFKWVVIQVILAILNTMMFFKVGPPRRELRRALEP